MAGRRQTAYMRRSSGSSVHQHTAAYEDFFDVTGLVSDKARATIRQYAEAKMNALHQLSKKSVRSASAER
jgi:hypothetical protein